MYKIYWGKNQPHSTYSLQLRHRLCFTRNCKDQWKAGRDFSSVLNSEKVKVSIINKAAAKALGWTPEEAIGNDYFGSTIIGVVKDFHMHSLHSDIQPLSITT